MIYAVNKQTKEHSIVPNLEVLSNADCFYVEADADGWIEWSGREQPLPDGERVELMIRGNGEAYTVTAYTDHHRWTNRGYYGDTIAYRPILDDKPQAPKWDGEGMPPVGTVCEYQNNRHCPWRKVEVTAIGRERMLLWDYTRNNEASLLMEGVGNFRPILSDRERWIEAAMDIYRANTSVRGSDAMGDVYDAMVSGDLTMPKTQGDV